MPKTGSKSLQHPPYSEMLDCAVHSAKGDKISRRKIYEYIEEHWGVNMRNEQCKEHFKQALELRIKDGRVEQEKQSFYFTTLGVKTFKEEYESSDEEEAKEQAKPVKSKKVETANNGGAAKKKKASK